MIQNEDSYFHEYTKNYFDEIEDLGESFLFVNDKFITSFSTRNDELDMWRFYGDDAKGVCMVFSNYEDSGVKSILYCDKEKTSLLKNIKHLLEELKATKINFRFPLFEHYSPFYKSKDFQNEEEHRLLIIDENPADWTIGNSFNILAPYIELPLRLKGANVGPKILTHKKIDAQSKHFPLVLNAIILGPEMPYKSINKAQLHRLINHLYGHSELNIRNSSISSYR